MKLPPKLVPFVYTPEYQQADDTLSFTLRPLRQDEMVAVEDLYKIDNGAGLSRPTKAAMFRAGMAAIVAVQGLFDERGEPVKWRPEIVDFHGKDAETLRWLICQCGSRIVAEMNGRDWQTTLDQAEALAAGLGSEQGQQPAVIDPEKT